MRNRIILIFLIFVGVCNAHADSKHALLIGISDYPRHRYAELTWNQIHGSNDVDLIKKTLKQQGFAITTLTDDSATAARIRSAFRSLIDRCGVGDMIYIHFSGHGLYHDRYRAAVSPPLCDPKKRELRLSSDTSRCIRSMRLLSRS